MFKTLIIFIARSFWETEGTPNPGRSFPHWRASMVTTSLPMFPDSNKISPVLQVMARHVPSRPGWTEF